MTTNLLFGLFIGTIVGAPLGALVGFWIIEHWPERRPVSRTEQRYTPEVKKEGQLPTAKARGLEPDGE